MHYLNQNFFLQYVRVRTMKFLQYFSRRPSFPASALLFLAWYQLRCSSAFPEPVRHRCIVNMVCNRHRSCLRTASCCVSSKLSSFMDYFQSNLLSACHLYYLSAFMYTCRDRFCIVFVDLCSCLLCLCYIACSQRRSGQDSALSDGKWDLWAPQVSHLSVRKYLKY